MAPQVAKARSCPAWAAAIHSNGRNHCGFPPAPDPDLWLCPASKGQSQSMAAGPALGPQRVQKGCRATAPKAAMCLGPHCFKPWVGQEDSETLQDILLFCQGLGSGWQACSEMPCLETKIAAAPSTPLAPAPQEHWAVGKSWLLTTTGKLTGMVYKLHGPRSGSPYSGEQLRQGPGSCTGWSPSWA